MVSMLMAMCSRFINTAEYPARLATKGISVEKAIRMPKECANLFSRMSCLTRFGRHISRANASCSGGTAALSIGFVVGDMTGVAWRTVQ